jgi:hypothetical protein
MVEVQGACQLGCVSGYLPFGLALPKLRRLVIRLADINDVMLLENYSVADLHPCQKLHSGVDQLASTPQAAP